MIDWLAAISPTEWMAVALALAYLLLAVRQNLWCWVCAALSAAIYVYLFAEGGLYMQSALQFYYIGMAIYGWYAWRGGTASRAEPLPVTRWPPREHLLAWLSVLALAGLNGWLLGGAHAVTYVDALVAWASVLTTWMTARKVLESWLYWIVIDLIAAALYGSQGLYATAVLFVLYSIIALRGYANWRSDARRAAGIDDAVPT